MDETAVIANLPNLEIKVAHRADPEDGAEVLAVQIKAFPSFGKAAEALARDLHPLLAGGMFTPLPMMGARDGKGDPFQAMMPWLAPMRMWSEMAERFWGAWLVAMMPQSGDGKR